MSDQRCRSSALDSNAFHAALPALFIPAVGQTETVRVRLIGYWRSESENGWPDPATFVDEGWDSGERDLIAGYLEQGFAPWAAAGLSPCRICGQPNGSAEFTDGVYVWPEGLAHYVRDHAVRLPDEVLRHISARYDEMEALDVDREWWATVSGR